MSVHTETIRTAATYLRHFTGNAQLVGEARGSLVIWRTVVGLYDYWLLTDNGGELNVERINEPDTMRSIPLDWFGAPLNASTIAYRIACVMDGNELDFAERMDDCEEVLRAADF